MPQQCRLLNIISFYYYEDKYIATGCLNYYGLDAAAQTGLIEKTTRASKLEKKCGL